MLTCSGRHEEAVLPQSIGFVRAPGPRVVDWSFVVLDNFNIIVDDVNSEQHSLDTIGDQTLEVGKCVWRRFRQYLRLCIQTNLIILGQCILYYIYIDDINTTEEERQKNDCSRRLRTSSTFSES